MKAIETTYKGYRFRSETLPATPRKRLSRRADQTGKRFGRALAVEHLGVESSGYQWWGCVCDCGTRFAARSRELVRGHTQSCGCLARERMRESGGWNRLPYGHASRNELLASYKKSANERGLVWAITDQEFFDLVAQPCAYCLTPPDSIRRPNVGVNGEFRHSGVDRINSVYGYEVGNVAPCCWNCNRAKGALSVKEFLAWADRLAAARKEQN